MSCSSGSQDSSIPKYDFHVHTTHCECANETMQVSAIVGEAAACGVEVVGIADHFNHGPTFHRPGQWAIKRDIEQLAEPPIEVIFGVEVDFTGPGQLPLDAGVKEEFGFAYAIAGIHSCYCDDGVYDIDKIVAIQHEHHLAVCRHEAVDVLVHPYWFNKGEFDTYGWPWFDTMSHVPDSFARELAAAARETNTAIEINGTAVVGSPHYSERFKVGYADYVAALAEGGVMFSFGSDAHDIGSLAGIAPAWEFAERVGIPADRIWRPGLSA